MTGAAVPIPKWDSRLQSWVVKRAGPWIVSVTPMIYNDRVLLTHVDQYPHYWTAGYCYDKGGAALLAAIAWDPLVEDRPAGFKKVAAEDDVFRGMANQEWRERDL